MEFSSKAIELILQLICLNGGQIDALEIEGLVGAEA